MIIKREKNYELIEDFLNNNFSSPTHWPDWNLIVSKFFSTDFFYFTAYENHELIGICPVHKKQKGMLRNLHSGQFHYIPNGGWIFNKKVKFNINDLPLKYNEAYLSFSLPLLEGFNADYNIANKQENALTLVINLKNDFNDIWMMDIDGKRRNMIRKAEKNNIGVINITKNNLNEFYTLYDSANKRYNIKSLPIDFFKELADNVKNIKFDILLSKHNDRILSGVLIIYDKNYSIYLLGFSRDNVPNLGQGELLQWAAINRMKDYGCKYYDLCYIEKERLPHIYEFKKGFSKEETKIKVLNKRPVTYKIINRLNKIF